MGEGILNADGVIILRLPGSGCKPDVMPWLRGGAEVAGMGGGPSQFSQTVETCVEPLLVDRKGHLAPPSAMAPGATALPADRGGVRIPGSGLSPMVHNSVWGPQRRLSPHNLCWGPCSCWLCVCRLTGMEDSAWGDDEEVEHNYYNSLPGKEPPPGGLVDSRLALTQPCALGVLGALGQVSFSTPLGRGARELGLNP